MEIKGYPDGKQSKIYKTALSKYEETFERAGNATQSDQTGYEEKTDQLNGENKIIRGEITDLKLDEATIRLEPDGRTITARIDGNVPLYIGQTAEFVITDKNDEKITLRLVIPDRSPADDLVHKALNTAGLAVSDKNMAIVRELLNFEMPVDKDTIFKMIKLANTWPEADIKTLVLLFKNQLPVNSVNISQFEIYKKGMHQILDELNSLSYSIGLYLEHITPGTDGLRAGNTLIPAGSPYLYATSFSGSPAGNNTGLTDAMGLNDILNLHKKILTILEDGRPVANCVPETPLQSVLSESELKELNEFLSHIQNDYSRNADMSDKSGITNNTAVSGRSGDSGNINNTAETVFSNDISRLNSISLKDFTELLSGLYNRWQIKPQGGQFSLPFSLLKAMTYISGSLSEASKEKLIHILKANNFHNLITEAFHNRWTISPENLKEEIVERKFFRRLYEDLEKLKGIANNKFSESSAIKASINKLQDNLQFMKDLNELFQYIQLPLRLIGRDAHGDLYVFTRRKKATNNKEQLNILLHLDMPNLGHIDIHMTMKERQVNAVFYIDETSGRLISEHLQELTDSLNEKGYLFHAETKISDSKPDFISDILQNNTVSRPISRYSFDIRA